MNDWKKEIDDRLARGSLEPAEENGFHVICCNDCVEFVVVGSEQAAEKKLEELAAAHYQRVGRWQYADVTQYRQVYYWHVHTVDGELGE